jgi:hypothetical protein
MRRAARRQSDGPPENPSDMGPRRTFSANQNPAVPVKAFLVALR